MSARRRIRSLGGGGGDVVILPPAECDPSITWEDTFGANDDRLDADLTIAEEVGVTDDRLGVEATIADTFGASDAVGSVDLTSSDDDTFGVSDILAPDLTLFDTFGATDDRLGVSTTLPDTFGMGDAISAVTLVVTYPETFGQSETRLDATFSNLIFEGDAYTDEGSPATNFGAAANLFVHADVVAVPDGQDAYMKFNFQRFDPFDAVDATLTVRLLIANNDLLLARDLTCHSLIQLADPWGESTITWNNAPAHPTLEGTISVAAGGTFDPYTLTLTTAFSSIAGNWLSLRFRNINTLDATTIHTIRSKEFGTAADRPRFQTFTVRHANVS